MNKRTVAAINGGAQRNYKYPECEACLNGTGCQRRVPSLNDGMVVANECAACADHKKMTGVEG
jgi:hypothetical protein